MALNKPAFCALALVLCLFVQMSMQQTAPFPKAVTAEMSSREARYHHYLWHNIRDNWNAFNSTTQQQLRDLGWAPPRPSRNFTSTGAAIAVTDNNSGEDFLYMHRQMIKRVNEIIANTQDPYGPVTGWKTLPAPGDAQWPVPADYTVPGSTATTSSINIRKTVDYYNNNIKPMEDFFKNPEELKKMTLGQLGSRIENTLHNWLHLRFSNASTYGYRGGSTNAIPTISTKWDDPRYDWLGDTYSSHVNPVFWKLHGWVNDRINDWARANNLTTITWRGTWQGGPMSTLASAIGITNSTTTSTPTTTTTTTPKLSTTSTMTSSKMMTTSSATATTDSEPMMAMAMPMPTTTEETTTVFESLDGTSTAASGMDHMSMSMGSTDPKFVDETMNEVFKIFAAGGKEVSFADDVQVDFVLPTATTTTTPTTPPKKKTNLRN